jgi:hypothetical protein
MSIVSGPTPTLAIQVLKHLSDLCRHDIESIEIYMSKQAKSVDSAEEISCLLGLQDMYRQRIESQEAEILDIESRPAA